MKTLLKMANVTKCYDDEPVLNGINLDIYDGEFLTLLGPSGCGKSTLLRLLAGLEQPDSGTITLDGNCLNDTPPEARQLNMVFQHYALFPHMTVFDNVAFGLQCDQTPKREIPARVMEALTRVKLQNLAHKPVTQISGGQQQRVAIARALVKEPRVLLLDEPLSALDHHLRKAMQLELKALQRKLGITFVLVTHDQEEALSLSDRIAVMIDGDIAQLGTPRTLYETPTSLRVAKFIGETNIFKTVVTNADKNSMTVQIAGQPIELQSDLQLPARSLINIVVRPEDFNIWSVNEVEHTNRMLDGTVTEIIYKGSTVDLCVQLANKQIIAATQFFDEDDEELKYDRGEKVWVEWQPGWEVILHGDDAA